MLRAIWRIRWYKELKILRNDRRHRSSCSHTSERDRRCSCPICVEGTLGGETIRRALDQTNWEAASEVVAKWTASGQIGVARLDIRDIKDAVDKHFEDTKARQLQPGTISKHTNLLKNRLLPWCDDKGFHLLKQLDAILKACDECPQQNSFGHDNRARVRAVILVLRYSGMRIGDYVGFRTSHLDGDKLSLNTEKTGGKIYVPLPPNAAKALRTIQDRGEYFFWTGNGLRKSAVADWQRALRRMFETAEVKGYRHMFRHTFATELLSKGVPIGDVSMLLGHQSIKITESYYSQWIKARRDRLAERVREQHHDRNGVARNERLTRHLARPGGTDGIRADRAGRDKWNGAQRSSSEARSQHYLSRQ